MASPRVLHLLRLRSSHARPRHLQRTRSGSVPSKMRKRPSGVSSMSWPVTVAKSTAASAVRGSSRWSRRAKWPGRRRRPARPPAPPGRPGRSSHKPACRVRGSRPRLQQLADLGGQQWRAGAQQPPDGTPQHRDRVLGGDRVLHGRRVQDPLDPTSPTRRASSQVTRKTRSGSWERRSRARRSTSTVWAKLAVSSPGTASATPAAYRQRTSKANRSAASRSESPSSRCRTMTTARIDGGTERRPVGSKRSANSSGGNNRARSRARNRYTDPSARAASHQRAPAVGSSGRRS
jgi:hypothetical protein